jgi:hypothetical protein
MIIAHFKRVARVAVRPFPMLVCLAAVTALIELTLVERKFGLFSGGFGQSKVMDSPLEIGALLIGAGVMHALLFAALWRILSWLHARRQRGLVLRYNVLMLGGAGFIGALSAKYQLLSYFSDAISFTLVKSLGGGSVTEAMMFGIHEGGMIVVAVGMGIAAYVICLFLMMRRDPKMVIQPAPKAQPLPKLKRWKGLAVLASVPALLLMANSNGDARYGNSRFLGYGLFNTGLDLVTDFDRDGYSWFSQQSDDAVFDASRHPFALDVPGNGIDEDGLSGDLAIQAPVKAAATPKFTRRPHIIHIVFESARADLIGKRINGKPVAPNLEALAAAGSVRPAYSPLGFTAGSLKAMFSGRIEPPVGTPSLFTDFKANGYRVSVFSGQAERFGEISKTLSMEKSADVFIDAEKLKAERAYGYASLASLKLDESILMREFERVYASPKSWETPNYIYFNFQSAHFPYHHPGMKNLVEPNPIPRGQINKDNAAWVERTYWNALAYADAALGELIADLKRMKAWDDTILIVTGDHGEALFEDGFLGHGHIINNRQYQTAMMISRPGYGSANPTGLVDYRAIIHTLVNGQAAPVRTEPVLMHIGPLDTPSAIGMAGPGGQMTILKLDAKEAQLADNGPAVPLAALDAAGRARVDQLVRLWGAERWRRALSDNEQLATP